MQYKENISDTVEENKMKDINEEVEARVKARTRLLEDTLIELEQTKKELSIALKKEKELNEMKTHFISTASHEFRTPLATIMTSFFLLLKFFENNNKDGQIKHINRITSSINYLTELLNDMFSLNTLEEGEISGLPEKFDIRELLSEIIQEMPISLHPTHRIAYRHSGNSELVLDKKIVKRIILNLISNAIKFSDQDKQVIITTEVKDSLLALSIIDQGIGISEKDQKHLFERFFRGENAANISGVGLGLSIVAEYLKLLNGKIEVSSNLNKGTSITIKIPDSQD